MKPNYKNWMPMGLIKGVLTGSATCLVLALVFGLTGLLGSGIWKTVLTAVFLVAAMVCAAVALWMMLVHRAFSYNGKRQLSRQIIDGVAQYVDIPAGGWGLDVGCGSGALAIAVAKRNPQGQVTGIDRWGAEYSSFSKELCEQNALLEGVADRTTFAKGNAVRLDFPSESLDAVFSNYVYHNIPSRDRQALLLESLRVLKKGGTFAIHDLFSPLNYGDMQAFTQRLKNMGYERVELIDTTDGLFMSRWEATWMALKDSALLVGIK